MISIFENDLYNFFFNIIVLKAYLNHGSHYKLMKGFSYLCSSTGGSDGKESAYSAGDPGLIPRSGRSPGEGNGNPLQYSCLENSIDREAWPLQSVGLQKVGHD